MANLDWVNFVGKKNRSIWVLLCRQWKRINYHLLNTIPRKAGIGAKWISTITLLMFVGGSVFEAERGYWFLWFMSCAILFVLALLEWGTWQLLFLNIAGVMPHIGIEGIEKIFSVRGFLGDSGISVRKFVILFLTLLSYAFILLMIASYFRMRG